MVLAADAEKNMEADTTNQHQVYLNGEFLPRNEAKISVFDSAVMLGDTVTESTRTFAHKLFKLEQHIERLYRSLKVTRISPGISMPEMVELSLRVLEQNSSLLAVQGNGQDPHRRESHEQKETTRNLPRHGGTPLQKLTSGKSTSEGDVKDNRGQNPVDKDLSSCPSRFT